MAVARCVTFRFVVFFCVLLLVVLLLLLLLLVLLTWTLIFRRGLSVRKPHSLCVCFSRSDGAA